VTRAAKVCADPHCPNSQPCPDHPLKAWAGQTGRRNRMRSGSKEQRLNRAVMDLNEGRCHVCGLLGADQVDHVIPLAEGGSDGMENRRPIHSEPCHRIKTSEEAKRGRNRSSP
jgi:5-methylcytosine-specific restriction enzyme A